MLDNGDSEFVVKRCFRGVGGLDFNGLAWLEVLESVRVWRPRCPRSFVSSGL
jgi:hypothetical protein